MSNQTISESQQKSQFAQIRFFFDFFLTFFDMFVLICFLLVRAVCGLWLTFLTFFFFIKDSGLST